MTLNQQDNSSDKDRRAHVRYALKGQVGIWCVGEKPPGEAASSEQVGRLLDIGSGGALLETAQLPSNKGISECAVEVLFLDRNVVVNGVVRYVAPSDASEGVRLGVEFEIPQEDLTEVLLQLEGGTPMVLE